MPDVREIFLGNTSKVQIGELSLDACLSEDHGVEVEKSEYAVEDGTKRQDHSTVSDPAVVIEGVVSDTPISNKFPAATAVDSVSRLIRGDTPTLTAWELLKQYTRQKDIITIRTAVETYAEMQITSLRWHREPGLGSQLRFDLRAEKYKVAYSEDVEKIPEPKIKTAEKKKDKGKKGKTDVEEGSKRESILFKGGSKLAGGT